LNNPSYGHPWTILETFSNIITSFSSLTTFYPYNNASFLSLYLFLILITISHFFVPTKGMKK
jgi:hypothetical protein